MTEVFRSIAVGARSQSREFMVDVAAELKLRFGSEIHLYCNTKEEQKFYLRHEKKEAFASVNIGSLPIERAFDKDVDAKEVFEAADKYEREIGLTINQMRVPHRHFGRGYSLAGPFHPRSRYSEEVDYLHTTHAYVATLRFWEEEIERRGITLFINAPREAFNMGNIKDIPYRTMALSRIDNLHFWSWTDMYESPLFKRMLDSLSKETVETEIAQPYAAHVAGRKSGQGTFSATYALKAILRETAQYAYWTVRGYQKAKGYYLSQNIAHHYRRWQQYRRLRKMDLKSFSELRQITDRKIVYYPLHVEPETALHGLSPEFFFQHELIASVSRDLPAGAILAVKEAYGSIGRRPEQFYRQIADLKNVVLIDPWEWGIECAQDADIVVTICGTSGLEALSAGVPVISYGQHNVYNLLPSVKCVHSWDDLAPILRQLLDNPPERNETAADARRLVQAIRSVSFDMREYRYSDVNSFSNEAVNDAVNNLVWTLTSDDFAKAE